MKFNISKDLGGGVSGKYFITKKQPFRFSLTDLFVVLFTGSVFLSALVFNEATANTLNAIY